MSITSVVKFISVRAAWCIACCGFILIYTDSSAQERPLHVCVAGLVHGHVGGFFDAALRRSDITITGIAEADTAVAGEYPETLSSRTH